MKKRLQSLKRLSFLPKLFFGFGVIFLVPLCMLIPFPQDYRYAPAFLVPAMISFLFSFILQFFHSKSPTATPSRQRDVVAVVAVWFYAFLMGGLPFFLAGQLSPLRSVFESVSGWTATGFTTMDVLEVPHIFLFYRSWMQFSGGIGFVIMILLFSSGSDAMRLFSAEGHQDKLEPSLIGTARMMMMIYLGCTSIGVIFYILLGMPWFDAINNAMAALATGGFTIHPDGIALYQSPAIEGVTIFLMLLGGTNFGILALVVKRNFKRLTKVGEIRFLLLILITVVPFLAFLGIRIYGSFGHSFRILLFQTVSAITSTGFSISSFSQWTPPMLFLLTMVMLIGGGAGSTAGGMKYSRVYLMLKYFWGNLKTKFLPERAVHGISVYTPLGKTYLKPNQMLQIHHFACIYLATFFGGTFLLSLAGVPLDAAMFEFASSLGTIGLSQGYTGADSRKFILLVQIVGMILARLEIYIVIVFAADLYRRVRNTLRKPFRK